MSSIFTIAEIAQAHEGSLGIAHSYIDALAATGVDAVKFQVHIAEAESSSFESFRVNFSYEDGTRFDYWKRMEFTPEQWMGLKTHCDQKGIEFFASPFSVAAVELLEQLNVKRYKIGSGEITNWLMLQQIARTKKEIILSSGMSAWNELDRTVDFLKKNNSTFSLLQCTTAYPTKPGQWGINVIPQLKERYGCKVGFSDHSGNIYACLAATAVGAEILEFHAVFDKKMFGPDAVASLEMDEIMTLVKGVREITEDLSQPVNKESINGFDTLKTMFGKSLAVNKDLPAGHQLQLEDLESKKPADKGYSAMLFTDVIGKRLKKGLNKWDFLTEDCLEK